MGIKFRNVAGAVALIGVFGALEGCAIGGFSDSSSNSSAASYYTIGGTVHMPGGSATSALSSKGVHPNAVMPVSGATIYLYAAGVSGYGSSATLLAQTTTATDGTARFSFTQDSTHVNSLTNVTSTYSCPSYTFSSPDGTTSMTADSYIYLVAVGGDTQDGSGSANSNSASVMMAALGDCQNVLTNNPITNISEATTVATVFALAPYMSPIYPTAMVNGTLTTLVGGALGTNTAYMTAYGSAVQGGYTSTGTNKSNVVTPLGYTGMVNAFGTVNKLVSNPTGLAIASFTKASSTLPGELLDTNSNPIPVTVTGTPEQAKINHIADILAYCIDTSNSGGTVSSQCSNLFSLAVPPISAATTSLSSSVTFTTATDTLQAAYYMATNPTNNTVSGANTSGTTTNLGKLYALVSGPADFQPTLAAQPTDWTIGIAYSSTNQCGTDTTPGSFISANPWSAASDLAGNVYLMNGSATSTTIVPSPTNSTLAGIGPDGTPRLCQLGSLASGRNLTLDINGYVWLEGSGSNLYQSANGATPVVWPTTDGTKTFTPQSIVADGKGDIFYNEGASGSLESFYNIGSSTTPVNSQLIGTTVSGGDNIYTLAVDSGENVWGTDTNSRNAIYTWVPTAGNSSLPAQYAQAQNANGKPYEYYLYALAVGPNNSIVSGTTCCTSTTSYGPDTVTRVNVSSVTSGGVVSSTTKNGAPNTGGVINTRATAVDGAGNVWVGMLWAESKYTDPTTSNVYGIWGLSEFSLPSSVGNPAVALSSSGSTPATCASGGSVITNCNYGGGYSKSILGESRGITIDISGNVWAASDLSPNTGSASAINGNLVEIVGAAVPVIQPLSIAVRDNLIATKP